MPITGHSLESTPVFVEMTARRGAGRELSQECPPIVASHDLSRPKPRGLMRGRYSCARNAAREKWLPLIQGSTGGKLREQGTANRASGFWNVWCHRTVRYETRRYPWRRQRLIPITG